MNKTSVVGIIMFLFLYTLQSSFASPNNAYSFYSLDANGTANDYHERFNLTPAATWKSSGCVIGGCYNLVSASKNSLYNAAASSSLTGTTNRTFKLWLNITGTADNYIVSYGTWATTGYGFGLALYGTNLVFWAQSDDIYPGSFTFTPNLNRWTMLTMTYEKTGTTYRVIFYVNDTVVENTTIGTALNTGAANFTVGCRNSGASWINGLVDEITIDTVVWTPTEVATVYANEKAGIQYPYPTTNTVAARVNPVNGTTLQLLEGYCTATHSDAANSTFNYTWYVNDTQYSTNLTATNYSSGLEVNVGNISAAALVLGANWTLGCIAYGVDGVNSTENNATSTISEYPFPQGFFHGYIFEDNLLDVNGTRNLGAYLWGTYPGVGPPATITYAAGRFGQGVYLNGSILLVNITTLNFPNATNNDASFAVWVKATNHTYSHLGNSTYGLAFLANIGEAEAGIEHHIYMNYGSYDPGYLGSTPYNISFERTRFGTTDYRCSGTQQLSETGWTHLAYVFDGTTIHGYINGTEVCTGAGSSANGVALTEGVALGNSYVNPIDSQYEGYLDSAYFYNDTLTSAQIKGLAYATDEYTCLYGGTGNWTINSADNCAITGQDTSLGNNWLLFNGNGAGYTTINRNILDVQGVGVTGTGANVNVTIFSGGGVYG